MGFMLINKGIMYHRVTILVVPIVSEKREGRVIYMTYCQVIHDLPFTDHGNT